MGAVTLEDVRQAQGRILDWTHRTPVLTSRRLNRLTGAELFFKCENFQKTGAFKARGALNAVLSLSDGEAERGVATHSSGNHAAAVSWAAALRGITATVVMPRTASRTKIAAVEGYGGRIIFCEPNHMAREETAAQVVRETGAWMIHPYNDPVIIAGQGTVALEFLGEIPDFDVLFAPVGGGGLLAGTAIVAKELCPQLKVYGAEPEGAADTSVSFQSGVRTPVANPASMADGLLAFVGDLTFPEIIRRVDGIVTVPDAAIASGMRQLLEILKIAVEPSGAVSHAGATSGTVDIKGRRVGIILSGGNVDIDSHPWAKAE